MIIISLLALGACHGQAPPPLRCMGGAPKSLGGLILRLTPTCHNPLPLVLFSKKSGKPPLWLTDHQYWEAQKIRGAERRTNEKNWAKDWAVTDSSAFPLNDGTLQGAISDMHMGLPLDKFATTVVTALRASKTEFAFMRKTLKEQVCREARKEVDQNLSVVMMTDKKFRTETYWTEYTQGSEGHMNLIVHYHCMVEGLHKYGMGDLQ